MDTISRTETWKHTLGVEDHGDQATNDFAERLRASFKNMRDRASSLADEIHTSLKELTVHDMTHIDALWEIVDRVFGPEVLDNPLEAYVLGGAFIFHDLGLALASYPEGVEELKQTEAWRQVSSRRALESAEDEQQAVEEAIRLNHAKQASTLPTDSFPHHGGRQYIIDDWELRMHLGRAIGTIAFSHWWDMNQVQESPDLKKVGAPPISSSPDDWGYDSPKLAYILRVSDACQVDARRAPALIQALRKPTGISGDHWAAQAYLQRIRRENDGVIFSSSHWFTPEEQDAWWVAFDLAGVADRELRACHDTFSSQGIPMQARYVAGASSPHEFAKCVPVDGWIPRDTTPRISNPLQVIHEVGGTSLYGTNLTVPLRELIQNARDAVAARRTADNREPDWGKIRVELQETEDGEALTVSDNGIGLTQERILNYLLDFGSSYWNSASVIDSHPDLFYNGFRATGRFGIGFYSVFMLGQDIKLVTRGREVGPDDTVVLHFKSALKSRPTLRLASRDEKMVDPGTSVTVILTEATTGGRGLLKGPSDIGIGPRARHQPRNKWTLAELVQWLCPCSDVDICISDDGQEETVVKKDDWLAISPTQLHERITRDRELKDEAQASIPGLPAHLDYSMGFDQKCEYAREAMRVIVDDNEVPIGRAAIIDNLTDIELGSSTAGIVTCGQFRASEIRRFSGVLIGKPSTATRYSATPLAFEDRDAMRRWSSEQAKIAAESRLPLLAKIGVSAHVRMLGGDLNALPVARWRNKYIDIAEFESAARSLDRAMLLDTPPAMEIVSTEMASWPDQTNEQEFLVLNGRMYSGWFWRRTDDPLQRADHWAWKKYWYSVWGALMEALAKAWNIDLQELLSAADIKGEAFTGPDTFLRNA